MIRSIRAEHAKRKAVENSTGGARYSRSEAGFIITVELLLVFTILIVSLLVALVVLRNALLTSGTFLGPVLVYDSTAPRSRLLGKVTFFDQSQTLRIQRRDPNNGSPILLGVRRDRWTSQSPIFYSGDNCQGRPFVHSPSSFNAMDPEVARRFAFSGELLGSVYAVGAGGVAGRGSPFGAGLLYASDPSEVPGTPKIGSVFISDWEPSDITGGPEPAAGAPWLSYAASPCRDLPDRPRMGLVPALTVSDPEMAENVLAPFLPPFGIR